MANYFVIGGDGKEYGPVTDPDVRQWIAEGRLNGDSRVKAESDAEFRALAQFPEFTAALQPHNVPAAAPALQTTADLLERDYELDIGACISRAWDLYKGNFGALFACFLIVFLVQMACGGALNLIMLPLNKFLLASPVGVRVAFGYVSSAALTLVVGPMLGGLFMVYLKTIRGQATGVGEVFAGFQKAYLQLFLGQLIVTLIVGACTMPFQYVFQVKMAPLLAQMQHLQNDPAAMQNIMPQLISAFTSSMPVMLICLVPVTFFTVCLQFTLPLIIDRQMTFATALKTSWLMVMKHWWYVFGLTVVAGLVSILGVFGCCIGVLFTVPIGLAAAMYAYETIFGAQKN